MWNRRDAGQEGYERWDKGQLGCRTGGIQDRRYSGQVGYRTGLRYKSGMMQENRDSG